MKLICWKIFLKMYVSTSLLVHYLYKDFQRSLPTLFCLIISCQCHPYSYMSRRRISSDDATSQLVIRRRVKPKISKNTRSTRYLLYYKTPKNEVFVCFFSFAFLNNFILCYVAWNNIHYTVQPPQMPDTSASLAFPYNIFLYTLKYN